MPRPEFNYLSYSYWIEFAALVFALAACGLFAAEVRFLRAPYAGGIDDKEDHDDYPYSPSNGSHMQLTHGRARLPQSDL